MSSYSRTRLGAVGLAVLLLLAAPLSAGDEALEIILFGAPVEEGFSGSLPGRALIDIITGGVFIDPITGSVLTNPYPDWVLYDPASWGPLNTPDRVLTDPTTIGDLTDPTTNGALSLTGGFLIIGVLSDILTDPHSRNILANPATGGILTKP